MPNDYLRGVPTVSDKQMDDWTEICEAFAKKMNAKLIFVNNTSCGLELPNGTHKHVYISEMEDFLKENPD